MRVGILFPHDPQARPPGIDIVRLKALTAGFRRAGVEADILAPVARASRLDKLPVLPLSLLRGNSPYDLVKTCYHQAIFLASEYKGPIVARLVRVVDQKSPARDQLQRSMLLKAQGIINGRAQALSFNNIENQDRWLSLYGLRQPSVLTPVGCPLCLPALGLVPYGSGLQKVVYADSLASPRQVELLNQVAHGLRGQAQVHFVGRNKSGLYGGDRALSSLVRDHGEKPSPVVWDYLRHAQAGLALAVGPDPFDNDTSKVVHYLRAGLPLVCEEPILQSALAVRLGLGVACAYDDASGMVKALRRLLNSPPSAYRRRQARIHMARVFSWQRTAVDVYIELFRHLLNKRPSA